MSINKSKQDREAALAKVSALEAYILDDNTELPQQELLLYLNDLRSLINGKRFGLVFEEHEEAIDLTLEENEPILDEIKELSIQEGGELNFLIEGDNLASLKVLEKSLAGKVDVIYIDPPYNTKRKDFRYDDDFVDQKDTFKHSKWLSFMEKRLKIAKRLLGKDGVIFISIDDRENSVLKLLCDDVFGFENFVGNVIWQKTYSPRNDAKGIPTEVEYILVYSRSGSWVPKRLPRTEDMDSRYDNPDHDESAWTSGDAAAPGASDHQGMVYAIQQPITGNLLYPSNGRHWTYGRDQMREYMSGWASYKDEVIDDEQRRAQICGCDVEDVEKDVPALLLVDDSPKGLENGRRRYEEGCWPRLYFTSNGNGGIRCKRYLCDVEGKMPTNYWPHSEVGHTDGATKELKKIFNGVAPFDTPKPTKLINRVLDISADDDSLVLDFFAGSGTTGQAVLEHNAANDKHCRFILCTNNEGNICEEVTYPRIKTAITGKREDGSDYSEGLSGSLKYMRVGYAPKDENDYYGLAEELLRHVKALVELENGIDFDTESTVAIVLSDDEYDDLVNNADLDKLETVYLGHDVFQIEEYAQRLGAHNVLIKVIPQYYYPEVGI